MGASGVGRRRTPRAHCRGWGWCGRSTRACGCRRSRARTRVARCRGCYSLTPSPICLPCRPCTCLGQGGGRQAKFIGSLLGGERTHPGVAAAEPERPSVIGCARSYLLRGCACRAAVFVRPKLTSSLGSAPVLEGAAPGAGGWKRAIGVRTPAGVTGRVAKAYIYDTAGKRATVAYSNDPSSTLGVR
jgi:hypothetical protein